MSVATAIGTVRPDHPNQSPPGVYSLLCYVRIQPDASLSVAPIAIHLWVPFKQKNMTNYSRQAVNDIFTTYGENGHNNIMCTVKQKNSSHRLKKKIEVFSKSTPQLKYNAVVRAEENYAEYCDCEFLHNHMID